MERFPVMDAMEAILSRRSIRKFTSEQVPDEMITELLKAAMSAPTATGEAWHFIVVKQRELLTGVLEFHPHAMMLKSAAAAIAVCGDPASEMLKGRWPMDCSAATQNMLIAANAVGLGACWVGIYPVEERITGLRKLLGIPEHIVPLSMVALGFPAETKQPSKRFRPDRIHFDKW